MKIVRFTANGQAPCYGVLESDLTITPIGGNIFGNWERADRQVEFKTAELLAPVEPPNIFAIGLNYRAHAAEGGDALSKAPILFIKPSSALAESGCQRINSGTKTESDCGERRKERR